MSDSVSDPTDLVGSEPDQVVTRTFERALADDHSPDNINTTSTLPLSQSVSGEIEDANDSDWFAFDVENGQNLRFELTGDTLTNVNFELRGTVGQLFNIGDNNSDNTTSSITFGFAITGTVYLVVSADGSETGTYTVSAVDPADLTIPGITVDEGSSDAGNSIAAATDTLISGDTFSGTLSSASDQDFVAIDVTANTLYTFDLQGAGAGNGTLEDGFLVLRDSNNNFIAQDDNSGTGNDAQIVYLSGGSSGTVYISARTFGSEGGTYSLVTSPEERTEDDGDSGGGDSGGGDSGGGDGGGSGGGGATVPGLTFMEGENDAAGSTATAYEIVPGDTFVGELESTTDRDLIRIQLTAGVEYQFDMRGSSTNSGTLPNPLLQLRDANDNLIVENNNSGTGFNAFIAFTPTESGTYYLSAIRDLLSPIGTYTLRTFPEERTEVIIDGITVDEGDSDAGNSIAAATDTLISGDTFSGTLSSASDQDFVAIDLAAGVEYTFDLQGAATGNGTLADGFLVLRDSNNNFIAQDDDSGPDDDAQIVYAPTSSGTFYISARTFGSEGGTYALVTRPLERTEGNGESSSSSASAQVLVGDTPTQDDPGTLDDKDILLVPDFTDDAETYSLVASDNSGAQTQVATFEGSADVQAQGDGYVTSAGAADMPTILDEAGLG